MELGSIPLGSSRIKRVATYSHNLGITAFSYTMNHTAISALAIAYPISFNIEKALGADSKLTPTSEDIPENRATPERELHNRLQDMKNSVDRYENLKARCKELYSELRKLYEEELTPKYKEFKERYNNFLKKVKDPETKEKLVKLLEELENRSQRTVRGVAQRGEKWTAKLAEDFDALKELISIARKEAPRIITSASDELKALIKASPKTIQTVVKGTDIITTAGLRLGEIGMEVGKGTARLFGRFVPLIGILIGGTILIEGGYKTLESIYHGIIGTIKYLEGDEVGAKREFLEASIKEIDGTLGIIEGSLGVIGSGLEATGGGAGIGFALNLVSVGVGVIRAGTQLGGTAIGGFYDILTEKNRETATT